MSMFQMPPKGTPVPDTIDDAIPYLAPFYPGMPFGSPNVDIMRQAMLTFMYGDEEQVREMKMAMVHSALFYVHDISEDDIPSVSFLYRDYPEIFSALVMMSEEYVHSLDDDEEDEDEEGNGGHDGPHEGPPGWDGPVIFGENFNQEFSEFIEKQKKKKRVRLLD